jgi:saccharopine dehydrogenase-like NADP-dependent oxidoreductase
LKKEVMLVTGAGQISMAIARRIGFGKKIILGDKKIENANAIAKIMNEAGYDVVPLDHPKTAKVAARAPMFYMLTVHTLPFK